MTMMKLVRERHGATKTAEYTAWWAMIQRCENHAHASFSRYGGRGITVCPAWRQSFAEFLAHVGRRPSAQHSLDRKDSDKGYEPGNVRWATPREQANNTRANRLFGHEGRQATVPEWAREFGVPSSTVWKRLRLGWDFARALRTPVKRQTNNAIERPHSAKRSPINRCYRYGGKIRTLKEWSTILGIDYHALYSRVVTYGWSFSRAARTPIGASK